MRRDRRQPERVAAVVPHQTRRRSSTKVGREQPHAGRGRAEGCPGKVSRFTADGRYIDNTF